ncbi:MAG: heavy-metal-associated domain-containing protein [Bacilli bacterium]|nr:heavy-metal-associated domain-containing protein [Bacilli bacterium]
MTKKIYIEGMSCQHCVRHVKEALHELDGVKNVEVDLKKKIAVLEGEVTDDKIKLVIEDAGYDVVKIELV